MPYSDTILEAPCAYLDSDAGLGVAEDLVAAHKWFNLAALKGNEDAKMYRKDLSDMMSSAEIAQAQKSAREWLSLMN